MDGGARDVDPEEPVDHPEDRLELLAALQPGDEVRLEHVDHVVLHQFAGDPRDLPARVDDQEVGSFAAGPVAETLERADQRDEVVLGPGRAHEPEGVGVRQRSNVRSSAVRMCFRPTVAGGPTVFCGHVGVDVGDGAPEAQRERRGGARQRALARVEAAEEQRPCAHRARLGHEPVVLVHGRHLRPAVHRRLAPRRAGAPRLVR